MYISTSSFPTNGNVYSWYISYISFELKHFLRDIYSNKQLILAVLKNLEKRTHSENAGILHKLYSLLWNEMDYLDAFWNSDKKA